MHNISCAIQIPRCPVLKQQAGDQPGSGRLNHAPQGLDPHHQWILGRPHPWGNW